MNKLLRIDDFKLESFLNEVTNKEEWKCTIKATVNYNLVEQPIMSEGKSLHKGRASSRAFENLFKERIEDESRKQKVNSKKKYIEVPYSLNTRDIDFNGFEAAKEEFLDFVTEAENR